jgi:glutathione S-transferase
LHAHACSGKAPFGQKPVYEEPTGLCIAQSAAILRHLARQHGYYGDDADEAARIDQAAEGVVDIRYRLTQDVFNRSSTEDQKAKAKAQFLADYLPIQFDIFSKLIERNGDSGYLVGSKVRTPTCVCVRV